MKYTCSICGHVYDDEKEPIPFKDLPDNWVCPLCGAAKSEFKGQDSGPTPKVIKSSSETIDSDMLKLSVKELAAVCSNLARGCEKQYKMKESELFLKLAAYFDSIAPELPSADVTDITKRLQQDLETGYENAKTTSSNQHDRGALRVCGWGEKVTRILNTLLHKYEQEGESFLANTEVWICTVCGFVYIGDLPPSLCPVCKVPNWKFEKIERRNR